MFSHFPYFRRYFVKACSFSTFNFFSSSSINCPSVMSSWLLLIFFHRFVCDFRKVSKQILKIFFSLLKFSSWLSTFSFSFELLFLMLNSSTAYHDNHDCQSSTMFLILFIWPWNYSSFSFWYGLVLSGHSYVSRHWHLLGYFFYVILFFPNYIDSQRTLHLVFALVSTHLTAASVWLVTKFSYLAVGEIDTPHWRFWQSIEVVHVRNLKATLLFVDFFMAFNGLP